MNRVSADANIFIHAADPDSPHHVRARAFIEGAATKDTEFVLCELVLLELYMQLRNAAIFVKPYSAAEAAAFCLTLKKNPAWRCVDYDVAVSPKLWQWAASTKAGFRKEIDIRLGLTLRHHGVTHFATANVKDFSGLGISRVWNPLLGE